ncbi:MAG TPA: hypothetical protein VFI26_02435 [Lysobacter sp.]|nr:hypothetical protein [Lysobacter sp.]
MTRNDDAFDARLRDAWRGAVDAVPPTLAWRLRPVRTGARAQRAPVRWPLGAAFAAAAVIALAIGLRSPTATSPVATPTSAFATIDADDATAPLDRSPDFYAWLASPDAEQLAME